MFVTVSRQKSLYRGNFVRNFRTMPSTSSVAARAALWASARMPRDIELTTVWSALVN